jgi:hypothetical protein
VVGISGRRTRSRRAALNPVLISDEFEVIAGHGRLEAAKMLGLKKVPTVRLSNLSPAERRAYLITENRLAELGAPYELALYLVGACTPRSVLDVVDGARSRRRIAVR